MSWTQTQCDQQMSRYGHFSQNKFFFGQLGRLPSFIHDFLWLHDFCTYLYTIFPKTLPQKKDSAVSGHDIAAASANWDLWPTTELPFAEGIGTRVCWSRRRWSPSLSWAVETVVGYGHGIFEPPQLFFLVKKHLWDFGILSLSSTRCLLFLCKLLVVLLLCGACLLLKTSTACFDGLKRNLKVGISGKASPFWAFHRSFVPRCAQSLRVVKVRCDANAWRLKWSSAKGRGEKTKRAFAKIWFLRWWRWYWTCLQVFQRVRELFLFSLFWLGWIFAAQHYPGCVADLICVI